MRNLYTSFVVVAHQDDWQLFMGTDVYRHIRDPLCRLVVIVTTAGNGKHGEYHWKSRLSGTVLSVCRALPSWSPYTLNHVEAAALPSAFSVSYDIASVAGKSVLQCEIRGESAARVGIYFLHVPEPLSALCDGAPIDPMWPQDAPPYRSWREFVGVLEAILLAERTSSTEPMLVHTAQLDPDANPGDHDDHRLTAQAVQEIARMHSAFRPVGYSMYGNQYKPENLDGADADDQRAAIYAYGGGYMATAAGFGETWRTGWEREYPVFKRRQYPKEHPSDDAAG